MFKDIIKRVKRNQLILTAIFMVFAIALLAIPRFNIINLINGPKEINPVKEDIKNYVDKYVQVDVYHPLDIYEEYYVKDSATNKEKVTHYSYLVMSADETYNNCVFYGVVIPQKYRSTLYNITDESNSFLASEESLPTYEPFKVKGTVKKMDSMQLDYFNRFLEKFNQEPLSEAYYIDHEKFPGNIPYSKLMGYSIFASICLLFAIIMLILSFSNIGFSCIKKYVAKHPETTLDMLDYEFNNSRRYTKNVWVSKGYVFVSTPTSINIIDLSDIVWAYHYKTNGRYKQSCIYMYNTDKKKFVFNASENEAYEILEYFEENIPHIVVAYTKFIEQTFRNNFNEFLKMQYLKPVEEPDDFFDNM